MKFITPQKKKKLLERPPPGTPEARRLEAFQRRVADTIETAKSLLAFIEVGTTDPYHVEVVMRELHDAGWKVTKFVKRQPQFHLLPSQWKEEEWLRIEPA